MCNRNILLELIMSRFILTFFHMIFDTADNVQVFLTYHFIRIKSMRYITSYTILGGCRSELPDLVALRTAQSVAH